MNATQCYESFFVRYPYKHDREFIKKERDVAERVVFTTTFFGSKNCSLDLHITAHSRYKLFINGKAISFGPLKSSGMFQFVDTPDTSDCLIDGENRIVVKVISYPSDPMVGVRSPLSIYSDGTSPVLLVKAELKSGNIIIDLSTGVHEWFACIDESVENLKNNTAPFLGANERYLSKNEPYPGSEDAEFRPVYIVSSWRKDPFGEFSLYELRHRTIPLLPRIPTDWTGISDLSGAGINLPFDVPPNSNSGIILDAGELTSAFIKVRVEGKNTKLRLSYYEKTNPALAEPDEEYYSDEIDVFNIAEYEPFHFRVFRYIKIDAFTSDDGCCIAGISMEKTEYPLEVKTEISSPQPWVNKLWDMSLRTLRLCMHETYEDCPYHEQMQYILDTRLEALYTYGVSNDSRLVLQALNEFHSTKMPEGLLFSRLPSQRKQVIPSFSLHYILMVYDYLVQTGDKESVSFLLPTVDGIINWFQSNQRNGLFGKLDYWNFLDWIPEWNSSNGAPPLKEGELSVSINLLFSYCLRFAAKINLEFQYFDRAAEYNRMSNLINDTVNERFFNEENQMYSEGLLEETYLQHAQVFAVLSGCAKGERAKRIMINTMNPKTASQKNILQCSFPMQFYLLRALEKTGLYHISSPIFLTLEKIAFLDSSTLPETPVDSRSACHGWSALALYEIPRTVLGVSYDMLREELILKPEFSSLSVKADVCTPFGMVKASVENNDFYMQVEYELPSDIEAKLILPNGTEKNVEKQISVRCMKSTKSFSKAANLK